MARPIVMPFMGMYIEEGVLTSWLREPGTRVQPGDAIAEVTTEKITFEVPSPDAGILYPVAEVGATLRVEAVMGYILADGETAPAIPAMGVPAAEQREPSGPEPVPSASDSPDGARRASPAARRLAAEHGIDISGVKGTGPGGRIVEADVMKRISGQQTTKDDDSEAGI